MHLHLNVLTILIPVVSNCAFFNHRVYKQRLYFRRKGEGIDVPLNDERIKKLNEIVFCWKARSDDGRDIWDDMYSKLLAFKKKHRECHGQQLFLTFFCILIIF